GFVFMILVSSLYITVALALGLFISATLRSQLLANQAAILLTYLPSFLLSDFVFPISNLPAPIAAVTYIVPARYFMKVLTGIYLRGTGIDRLWPDLAALGAMLAVLSFFCVRILKREGM
ncbi:MAG TPA: ABC transporter permease, partial [Deltaproteobacteria bacterium]|nr:ABC transporter permease [Deltaproteobacteria bacterium]